MSRPYIYWIVTVMALVSCASKLVESIQGQHTGPGVCVDEFQDCINEPLFKRCNQTTLTPRTNITVTITSSKHGTAELRCVDFNNRNSVYLVPGFSWLKWNQSHGNLDIDHGSFEHIMHDSSKYHLKKSLYRQDLHAQWLTIKDLSESDFGLYTCVICSKYGRSYSSILLKPAKVLDPTSMILPPTHSQPTTTRQILPPKTPPAVLSSPNYHGTSIALFAIGSVVVVLIILGIIYGLRSKIFKSSQETSQQTGPEAPFLNEMIDTSKPNSFNESAVQRKWSTPSTVTSILSRGSTSSTFPFIKTRNSSSSRSPYSGQMMYISEIADLEDVFEIEPDEEWEIPREHIVFQEQLGEGAFGIVMKATAYGLNDKPSQCTVAVKMIKDDAVNEEIQDFLSEIETMKHIGHHKNIINMLGTCSTNGPILLVVEHAMHGNLRDFLRAHRTHLHYTHRENNNTKNGQESLTIGDLASFAYQAAKGMEYLASQKCVHRDLAARNVLVAEDYVVKIADFGLSRNVKATDYYRKTTHGRLPIMWLSIEALFDQKYTIMSDVWSYGVLLWEIFTLGSSPYPGISIEQLFTLLKTGYRMSSPVNCPPEIYALMLRCWNENENDRPTMEQVAKQLDSVLVSSTNVEYLDIIAQISNITSADTNEVTKQTIISDSDGQETNV